jgi:hypothetical protein
MARSMRKATTKPLTRVKPVVTTELVEGKFRPKKSYTPAEAKKWFRDICNDVTREKKRAYVKDRQGKYVVTLDPVERNLRHPVLDVSVQRFKDQFSRFCALVRIGACFRLTRRGNAGSVYARRHTDYHDPLDAMVERWLEGRIKNRVGRLAAAVEKLADRDAKPDPVARLGTDLEELRETQRQHHKAIWRVANKLPPFVEDPTQPHPQSLGLGGDDSGNEPDS